jgi:molybdate-binding protein
MVVARGNPLGLQEVADFAGARPKLAIRPPGAGAQQLLLALAKKAGIGERELNVALVAPTGPDIAQAIRAGHCDCGIATRAIARAAELDFVPLVTEQFDILMRQRDSYREPLATFVKMLRSSELAERAAELGGLDVAAAGSIRWAP